MLPHLSSKSRGPISAAAQHLNRAPVSLRVGPSRTFFSQVDSFEKALVFKSGRYAGEKSPGLRLDVPVLHELRKVDTRIQTLTVPPQELMTKDNVTIQVDAVSFFQVVDAQKALLNVVDYKLAVNEAAQTTLRSQLSRSTFDELLSDREEAGQVVLAALQQVAEDWGVRVRSVQLKNVKIDPSMVRAMGRKAEAHRVRDARLIEADAEVQASRKLVEAAHSFDQAPLAMRLRELQTYAQIAAEGNTVLIPANMSQDVHQALTALRRTVERQRLPRHPSAESSNLHLGNKHGSPQA